MLRHAPLAVLALVAGCSNHASVSFNAGFPFSVSSDSVGLPPALRHDDGTGGAPTIASVPCDASGGCSIPGVDPTLLACNSASLCDPTPIQAEVALPDVIDFDVLAGDLKNVLDRADEVTFSNATYTTTTNTLDFDVPALDLYWGPEEATSTASPGVYKLGTVPAQSAGATGTGDLDLDADGGAALSAAIVAGNRRIRVFVKTQVDLAPGQPFPAGSLMGSATLTVRVRGPIVS